MAQFCVVRNPVFSHAVESEVVNWACIAIEEASARGSIFGGIAAIAAKSARTMPRILLDMMTGDFMIDLQSS